MLPAMALLLDYKRVDSRVVSMVGLGLILASCIGSSFLTVYWNRDQFYLWQLLQAVGQPMVIMPLLMMTTNSVAGPAEGPFVAALVNTSRAVAEAASAWFVALIDRWRNALHSDRIIDQAGQDRWRVLQSNGVLPQYPPPLMPDGQPRVPNSLEAFRHAVEQQAAILSTSDTFLILGALTVFLMVVVVTLPVHPFRHASCLQSIRGIRMAEDLAEPETRPAAPERNKKPDLARGSDDPSPEGWGSTGHKEQEADRFPRPARWPPRCGRMVGDLRRGGAVHHFSATPGRTYRRCLRDGPLRHDCAAHLRTDRLGGG
jgi:hypothetical protein